MSINEIGFILFCLVAGASIAAAFVAFISLIGIFDKLSEKFKCGNNIRFIEGLIIIGVTFANSIDLFGIILPFGTIGFIIFNLFGGIFVGCLAGALAETLNIFPIISRRFNIRNFLPYVLIIAAMGKAIGCIVQLLLF